MDTVPVIVEAARVILAFLNLFFIPGFVISLVFFPRFADLGLIQRLVYSLILSIGAVIAFLFVDIVLGVGTTPGTISLTLGVLSAFMLVVWLCEIWYLNSSLPVKLNKRFSGGYQEFQIYFSRIINSARDRFTNTAMARVVWHENVMSERNHINHSYLIDIGEEIDIQQVDENKWNSSDRALLPPPHPRARYFELYIRENNEDGISLIDDLQVYPVQITKKSEGINEVHSIQRRTLKIARRIYKKTDTSEIRWIYSHDFHLFGLIHPQDTLGLMVDRVLLKLDEIVISIKNGSRISSHVEVTEKLNDEFDAVPEKSFITRTGKGMTSKVPESPVFNYPTETDRRMMHAEIVRNLKADYVTPETFRRSDRMIAGINIPEKTDIDSLKTFIREMEDDGNYLYE